MPPLDVSWNPYEMFNFENCFINLNNLLKKLKGHYYNHFQYNSLTYIQINIASTIIKNKIFFDDEINDCEVYQFGDYEFINDKLSIKDKKIVYEYFKMLDLEFNNLLENIKGGIVSTEKEEIEESAIQILQKITILFKNNTYGT
jgi:hypothetical protein